MTSSEMQWISSDTHLWIVFLDPCNARDLGEAGQREGIVPQRMLVCGDGVLEIAHLLGHPPWGTVIHRAISEEGGERTDEEPGLLVCHGELVDGAGCGVGGVGGGQLGGCVGGGGVHGGVAVEMGRGSEDMGVVHAHVPVWLAGDVAVGHGWGDGGGRESRPPLEAVDIYTKAAAQGKSGTLMGVGTITADHRSRRR